MKRAAIVFFLLLMGGVFWQKYHNAEVKPSRATETSTLNETDPSTFQEKIYRLNPVVFTGLPHSHWQSEEFKREVEKKQWILIQGEYFYKAPAIVQREELAKLQAFAVNNESFRKWAGAKACGGFHPDVALEWRDGQQHVYSMLLCFGCGEAKLYGPSYSHYCDLKYESEAKKLFGPYFKGR